MGTKYNVKLTATMLDGVMKDPETKLLVSHIANQDVHFNASEKNAVNTSIAVSESNISMLMGYITQLQDQIISLKQANAVPVSSITSVSDPTKDVVITVSEKVVASDLTNSTATVTAKSVNIASLNTDSVRLNITASDDVVVSNFVSEGTLAKSISNASTSIHSDGYVTIKDCTIGQSGYNSIEIGLTTGLAKGVTIDNVHFSGTFGNNAILIFGTEDGAIVNISNCIFDDCSNPIRISNRSNGKVTINIVNCEFTKWASNLDYGAMILCEDYTSKSVAAEETNNLFAPQKVKINIINCTHNGQKIVADKASEICGSKTENQLIYVYNDYGSHINYDTNRYPELVIDGTVITTGVKE